MRKGILLLNGEPFHGEIAAENAYVLCCDGAYAWAKDRVKIDENIGDFDSLSYIPTPAPSKIYPSEKDLTDGEIGLDRLLETGCKEVEIYGGGGGREDHFLGNLHLLYRAYKAGVKAEMVDNGAKLFLASGEVKIENKMGKTLSLLPFFGDAHIINGTGFHYPLNGVSLAYGTCRGISNKVENDRATFTVDRGIALVVINEKEV